MAHKNKWSILLNIHSLINEFYYLMNEQATYWLICLLKMNIVHIKLKSAGRQAATNDGVSGYTATSDRVPTATASVRPYPIRILFTNAPHPSWKCLLTRMGRYKVISFKHPIYVCLRYCKHLIYSLCTFNNSSGKHNIHCIHQQKISSCSTSCPIVVALRSYKAINNAPAPSFRQQSHKAICKQ